MAAFSVYKVVGKIKEGYTKALLSRGKVVLVHAIKTYVGSSGIALVLDRCEWASSRPGCLTPGRNSSAC
jgi:hypothetical protein